MKTHGTPGETYHCTIDLHNAVVFLPDGVRSFAFFVANGRRVLPNGECETFFTPEEERRIIDLVDVLNRLRPIEETGL